MFTKLRRGAIACVVAVAGGCQSSTGPVAQTPATAPTADASSARLFPTQMQVVRKYDHNSFTGSSTAVQAAYPMDRTEFRLSTGAPQSLSKADIMTWTNNGMSDEAIIDRIQRSGATFKLTAADQIELLDHGVSKSVVQEMRDTGRR